MNFEELYRYLGIKGGKKPDLYLLREIVSAKIGDIVINNDNNNIEVTLNLKKQCIKLINKEYGG